MLKPSFVVLCLCALVSCESKKKPPEPAPKQSPKDAVAAETDAPSVSALLAKSCEGPDVLDSCIPDCPRNAPSVNVFPVNGIDSSGQGECNGEKVRVVPKSLRGGGCGEGADLVLSDDREHIVGKRGGAVVCHGDQLEKASFQLGRKAEVPLVVTIQDVRPLKVDGKREGYLLDAGEGSLCQVEPAASARKKLGLEPIAHVTVGNAMFDDADLTIVVAGRLYTESLKPIDKSENWFNLACATDALAKLALEGLYDREKDDRNRAGLRMFTANYCGTAFTVKGVTLIYEEISRSRVPESDWSADRATCLGEPRLLSANIPGMKIPEGLPDELQPKKCKQAENGQKSGKPCDSAMWLAAVRDECHIDKCPTKGAEPRFYRSFVDKTNKKGWQFDKEKK